jgi:hypothetical protein
MKSTSNSIGILGARRPLGVLLSRPFGIPSGLARSLKAPGREEPKERPHRPPGPPPGRKAGIVPRRTAVEAQQRPSSFPASMIEGFSDRHIEALARSGDVNAQAIKARNAAVEKERRAAKQASVDQCRASVCEMAITGDAWALDQLRMDYTKARDFHASTAAQIGPPLTDEDVQVMARLELRRLRPNNSSPAPAASAPPAVRFPSAAEVYAFRAGGGPSAAPPPAAPSLPVVSERSSLRPADVYAARRPR